MTETEELKIKVEDKDTGDVPVKVQENPILLRILPAHNKVSRPMTNDDFGLIDADLRLLYQLCTVRNGLYASCWAMAHPQIEDITPCRVFVTIEHEIIINPVITNHTKTTVDSIEGCMTFSYLPPIVVPRYHKIEVQYQTVMTDKDDPEKIILSPVMERSLSGQWAKVWQHEIDHLDAKYIYSSMVNN